MVKFTNLNNIWIEAMVVETMVMDESSQGQLRMEKSQVKGWVREVSHRKETEKGKSEFYKGQYSMTFH